MALALGRLDDLVLRHHVLLALDGESAFQCAAVCKCWRNLICNEALWSELWQHKAKNGAVGVWRSHAPPSRTPFLFGSAVGHAASKMPAWRVICGWCRFVQAACTPAWRPIQAWASDALHATLTHAINEQRHQANSGSACNNSGGDGRTDVGDCAGNEGRRAGEVGLETQTEISGVFDCENDCGFSGSYAEVEAHERSCLHAHISNGGVCEPGDECPMCRYNARRSIELHAQVAPANKFHDPGPERGAWQSAFQQDDRKLSIVPSAACTLAFPHGVEAIRLVDRNIAQGLCPLLLVHPFDNSRLLVSELHLALTSASPWPMSVPQTSATLWPSAKFVDRQPIEFGEEMYSFCPSPMGTFVAAGSHTGRVSLHGLRGCKDSLCNSGTNETLAASMAMHGRRVLNFHAHRSVVSCIQFIGEPKGLRGQKRGQEQHECQIKLLVELATASWDGTVKIWSVTATGRHDDTFSHANTITNVVSCRAFKHCSSEAFVVDTSSGLLFTGSGGHRSDGLVRCWDLSSGELLDSCDVELAELEAFRVSRTNSRPDISCSGGRGAERGSRSAMDMRHMAAALQMTVEAEAHAMGAGGVTEIPEHASHARNDESRQSSANACKCSITSLVAADGGELLAACTDDTVVAVHVWRIQMKLTAQAGSTKGSHAARSVQLEHLRVIRAYPRRPRPGEPQEQPPFPHVGALHFCGDTLFAVLSDMRMRSINMRSGSTYANQNRYTVYGKAKGWSSRAEDAAAFSTAAAAGDTLLTSHDPKHEGASAEGKSASWSWAYSGQEPLVFDFEIAGGVLLLCTMHTMDPALSPTMVLRPFHLPLNAV